MTKRSMNLYVTTVNEEVLRTMFLNMRFSALVSVPEILEPFGEDYYNMTEYTEFIVSKSITNQIADALRRKRYLSVIYSNPWIGHDAIVNIHNYYKDNKRVKNIVLLDYKDKPENEDLWQYFNMVTYFPSVRKKRILECETLKLGDDIL